ncbi:hypothetical protein GJ496_004156 [Pomphorhynchus laevis]|nr:hypothetical protein GJ496_004156 [Pomphorhynchus laevis]
MSRTTTLNGSTDDVYNITLKFALEERDVTIVRSKRMLDHLKYALNEDAFNMISDLYGDDMDVKIMEDVMYFSCTILDGKPSMKPLNSFRDIKNGSIIEIVVWSSSRKLINGVYLLGHNLIKRSTRQIKTCRQCKRHIWGIGSHVYCTLCGAHVHRKCAFELSAQCRSTTRLATDSLSDQEESSNVVRVDKARPDNNNTDTNKINTINIDSNDVYSEKVPGISKATRPGSIIPKFGFATISHYPNYGKTRIPIISQSELMKSRNPQSTEAQQLNQASPKVIKNVIYDKGQWSGTFAEVKDGKNIRYRFKYRPETQSLAVELNDQNLLKTSVVDFNKTEHVNQIGLNNNSNDEPISNDLDTLKTNGIRNVITNLVNNLSKFENSDNIVIRDSVQIQTRNQEELSHQDFHELYQVKYSHVLGAGRFAKVYEGFSKTTSSMVAIKMIRLDKSTSSNFSNVAEDEAKILLALDYPAILRCEGMFKSDDQLIIITEKLDIDLLEYIVRNKTPQSRLTEYNSKFLCFQIICALNYLHAKNIAHCDLKTENVLVRFLPDNIQQIKLADFGYASIIRENTVQHSLVGTPAYLPPEVFNKEIRISKGYDVLVDLWAFGVIIYVSLSGFFPYRDDRDLILQIAQQKSLFKSGIWKSMSSSVKDLISTKLLVDSSLRINATAALKNSWFICDDNLCWKLMKLEHKVGQSYLSEHLRTTNQRHSQQ